jgi:hypothetical protein
VELGIESAVMRRRSILDANAKVAISILGSSQTPATTGPSPAGAAIVTAALVVVNREVGISSVVMLRRSILDVNAKVGVSILGSSRTPALLSASATVTTVGSETGTDRAYSAASLGWFWP